MDIKSFFKRRVRLFKNKDVLFHDYIPDKLPGREKQIEALAEHLKPALDGERPGNLTIYGTPGSGKTAVTNYVLKMLNEVAKEENVSDIIHTVYISCPEVPSQSPLLQRIISELRNEVVKLTGWGIDKHYEELKKTLSKLKGNVILVLDEIDKVRNPDDLLYNLTRLKIEGGAKLSIIGISNNLKYMEYLDSRVRSSLGRNRILFPPYNAEELVEILHERAKEGIRDGVLDDEVIPYCSALAAQRDGDARLAIDLLREAVTIAESEGVEKVTKQHVNKAFEKIEMDNIEKAVASLTLHQQAVLMSIIVCKELGLKSITTGDVYSAYIVLCDFLDISPATRQWVSETLNQFDIMGIINSTVISRGRYGRTRRIDLGAPLESLKSVLLRGYRMEPLRDEYGTVLKAVREALF